MAPDSFAAVAAQNVLEVILPWTIVTTIFMGSVFWILLERIPTRLRVTRFELDPTASPYVVLEYREMGVLETMTGWRYSKGQTKRLTMTDTQLAIAHQRPNQRHVWRFDAVHIRAASCTPLKRAITIDFHSDWPMPTLCLRVRPEEPVVSLERVQTAVDLINRLAAADRARRRDAAA